MPVRPGCRLLPTVDPEVARVEAELDARSFAIPLQSRVAWARAVPAAVNLTAIATDHEGSAAAMLALSATGTRALPLHRVARLETITEAYATDAGAQLLRAITDRLEGESRILRVTAEVECADVEARSFIAGTLARLGYARVRAERSAERTIALDLGREEKEILAGFRTSHRQNIRNIGKFDLQLEVVRDAAYSARMNELLSATMARTGGASSDRDWGPIMKMGDAIPHRSRLVGVFQGADRGPPALLGFAWGMHHGGRAEYSTGASTRVAGNPPLLHAVLWDLITWARREGAAWFDFGGVTPGGPDSDDPLGRISFFKRGFSREEIEFGQEWVLSPRPWKDRLARTATEVARRLRNRGRVAAQAPVPSVPEVSPEKEPEPAR